MPEEAVVIKLRAEIKDVKKSLDALNKKISKSTKKMSDDFKSVGKDIIKNFAAALSIKTLGKGIKNLSEMAAKAEGVSDSFERMVESTGAQADVFKNELRAASRGTISDLKLMTKTNQAMILLGKESVKDIPKLIEIARASAKATGESVDFLFDSIVLGLGRSSKMILDNLGIVFSAEKANEKFALSIGTTADKLTEAQKKQAFFNATMKAGDKIIDQVGDATDLAGDAQARMNAALENASLELGKKFLPRWQKFVTLIAKAATASGGFIKIIENLIRLGETVGTVLANIFLGVVNAITLAIKTFGSFMKAIANGWKNPKKAFEGFLKDSDASWDQFRRDEKGREDAFMDEISDIWDDTENDKTKSTKKGIRARVEAAIAASRQIKKLAKSEVDFFREKASVTVTMFDALTTRLNSNVETLRQRAEETNDEFTERVKAQSDLVKARAEATFNAIQQFAVGATNAFSDTFALWTEQMVAGTFEAELAFQRMAKGMLKFILEALGKSLIQKGAAKVAEAVAASLGIFTGVAAPGLFAAGAKLSAVGGVILGLSRSIKLAEGGLVTGPTFAQVGEKEPELVIPLSKLGGFLGGVNLSGSSFGMVFPNVRREEDLRGGRFARTAASELARGVQGLNQRSGIKRRANI